MAEFWSSDRGLTLVTISIIIQIFFVTPFGEAGIALRILCDMTVAGLLIAGALSVHRTRIFTAVLIVSVLATAIVLTIGRIHPTVPIRVLGSALVALTLSLYIHVVVVVMFRGGPMNLGRIQGGVCSYLLLGMAWASVYQLVEQVHPGSFRFVTPPQGIDQLTSKMVYFSFGTLTTVGSEISALAPFARSLATAEAVVGQLFPSVFIGALVTLAMQARPAKS
jgi:Ion channel